jgi:hypothetical protein
VADQEKMRQSFNKVEVEGWVNKKTIEEKTNETTGAEYISGVVEIRISETNIIPIELYANKTKKDGKPNSIYKGIKTIKEEYVSATQAGKWQDADKVRVTTGFIRSNDFVGKNDNEVHTGVKYSSNFINRVTDDTFEPKATFSCEVIFSGDREETKDGDATGRGFIDCFYVDYNGKINPVSFAVPEKYWGKVQGELEKGETLTVHGDIMSNAVTKTIITEMDFGEDEERVITTSIKERLIKGLKRVDEEKAYKTKDIKKAIQQRQKDLKELTTKPDFSKDVNTSNDGVIIDEDDLPF